MVRVNTAAIWEHNQHLASAYTTLSRAAEGVAETAGQMDDSIPDELRHALHRIAERLNEAQLTAVQLERTAERVADRYTRCSRNVTLRMEEGCMRMRNPDFRWTQPNSCFSGSSIQDINII